MKSLRITVIIAAYNGEKYITEQLNSISGQNCLPDEVLIGDDGSSDMTTQKIENWIKAHPEINVIFTQNETRLGYKKNFYSLMKKASGDIVFFCDQDDIWKKDKIERMSGEFKKNPEIGALSSSYDVIDAEGNVIRKERNSGKLKKISHSSFLRYPAFPGMTMAYRKQTGLKTLKQFDRGQGAAERAMHDWAVSYTASREGGMFFLDVSLSEYRRHGNNVSGMIQYEYGKVKREKRIRLVEELIDNMRASGDEQLLDQVIFESERLEMLRNGQALKLLFYEVLHMKYTRLRPLAGDLFSLL